MAVLNVISMGGHATYRRGNYMELPLSRRERKLYKELKQLFLSQKDQALDSYTYHKYEEWLILLTQKGVLWHVKADGAYLYQCEGHFEDFEEWIKDQDKKARQLNSREWKIAIVSAIIGALIGLIPTVINFL